jgi:hypothetical protein
MARYNELGSLPDAIVRTVKEHRVTRSLRRAPRVYTDTTDFTALDYGDIIQVEDRYFLITSYTKEGRFGVDDQIKQWVPKVEDLATGTPYIVKLVFYETFDIRLGPYTIPCYRSPEKEARILELVQGRPHFMQGELLLDAAGNLIRVIVPVSGNRLDKVIQRSELPHQAYFFEELPNILKRFLDALEAIRFLHENGFRHGDIRRDHIFVDRNTGLFYWIDFDYDFYLPEKPFALDLLELGNVLLYLVGKGDYNPREILADPNLGEAVLRTITPADFALLSQNKMVNLRKIFPYIPEKLNNILLHFSVGSEVFYENVEELQQDLRDALPELSG